MTKASEERAQPGPTAAGPREATRSPEADLGPAELLSTVPGLSVHGQAAARLQPTMGRYATSLQRLVGNRAATRLLRPPLPLQRVAPAAIPEIDVEDLPAAGLLLVEGSTGDTVRKLQLQLNFQGATPPLAVDGEFGSKTRRAVVDFQRSFFTADPAAWDGRVGAITWQALFEHLPGQPGGSDAAAYQGAIADHKKDLESLEAYVQDGLKAGDVMTRNSCEQVSAHRMKIYALTPTGDSAERAKAAGSPGGVAYFSYPAGALYEAPVPYAKHPHGAAAWDNTNVHIEASPEVDGFQAPGVIALMQSAIKRGKGYFLGVLRHEVQHFVDDHGDTDIEGYKTEFRAYWLGSREYDPVSPTTFEHHKGYRWNSRQWAIFDNLYSSADYAYVKSAWDGEDTKPKGSRPFQQAVLAFSQPDSVNRHNSMRVADFDKAIRAVNTAACGKDAPGHPDPLVAAVRQAHQVLDADDKRSVKASSELQALVKANINGQLGLDIADVTK